MKQEYIITEDILRSDYGLILSDYALDTTYVEMIIRTAFGKAVTEILYLNDNFGFESDIENALDKEPRLVGAFFKLQYQIIYNLIFLGDSNPINAEVDDIICSDLHWGKINGFQKHLFTRG